jgi:hypothetical protein
MDGVSLCKTAHSDGPPPGEGSLSSVVSKVRTGTSRVDGQRTLVSAPQRGEYKLPIGELW